MAAHKDQTSPSFWMGYLAQTIHAALKTKPPTREEILEDHLRQFRESAACTPTLRKGLK